MNNIHSDSLITLPSAGFLLLGGEISAEYNHRKEVTSCHVNYRRHYSQMPPVQQSFPVECKTLQVKGERRRMAAAMSNLLCADANTSTITGDTFPRLSDKRGLMNRRYINVVLFELESWNAPYNAPAKREFILIMRAREKMTEQQLTREWERYLREDCEPVGEV